MSGNAFRFEEEKQVDDSPNDQQDGQPDKKADLPLVFLLNHELILFSSVVISKINNIYPNNFVNTGATARAGRKFANSTVRTSRMTSATAHATKPAATLTEAVRP